MTDWDEDIRRTHDWLRTAALFSVSKDGTIDGLVLNDLQRAVNQMSRLMEKQFMEEMSDEHTD